MARTNHLRALVVMAAAALAASLLVAVVAGKLAQASFPGANGLIAFVSDRYSTGGVTNDDIYVMNAEPESKTNVPTRLTTDPAVDQWPALSPDGTKVAFQRFQDDPSFSSGSEIYVMDVEDKDGNGNGDNLTRLTNNSWFDNHPAWSADGTRIVFNTLRPYDPTKVVSPDNPLDQEIYVMDAKDKDGDGNGDNLKRLTTRLGFDAHPVFSPKGDRIAFVSRGARADNPERDGEIYVMNSDGSNPTNLTNNSVEDAFTTRGNERFYVQLAWSPDGSKIAFPRWEPDGNVDIHVVNTEVNSDGPRTETNLTNTAATDERYPAWSPDGTKIAFWQGYLDSNAEIYVMNSDGSGTPKNLTNNSFGDIQPDWGRDTTKPEITLRTPAEGDTYILNQSVTANYECVDEGGSGLASCVGDVPDGASIDTSSVGDKTFTVTAKDNGGNTNSVTHNYRVVYDFKGFFDPVDNPPTLNSAKAGRAIPVKFSLSGDQGLNVLAEGYPKSQEISCDSAAQVNGAQDSATANGSGLTYDASTDEYTYVWKTDKAWAGTCRQLVVKLKDGTEYKANFKLR